MVTGNRETQINLNGQTQKWPNSNTNTKKILWSVKHFLAGHI